MILGIDFGASTTDFVLVKGKKIIKAKSIQAIPLGKAEFFLLKFKFNFFPIKKIKITGGKSAFFKGKILGRKPLHVPELKAIALGALTLTNERKALIASLGTGTAIINAKSKKKLKHLGGTGISGGTLLGLSKLILKTQSLKEIERLASKGKLKNVDLTVEDIIGKGIGIIPGKATASNFAKLQNHKKEDLALAIINLIAEANAMALAFTARETKQKKIILIGKLAELKSIQKRLKEVLSYFKLKFIVAKNAGIATAYGAAIAN